jgi:hypothetical protein
MTDLTVTWAASRVKWAKRRLSLVSRFVREMQQPSDENGDQEE